MERPFGSLKIVKRRQHYHRPKPQQVLTVIQPQVTILPPAPKGTTTVLTVNSTTRRTSWGEETYVQASYADGWGGNDASTYLLAAVLNFITKFSR